MHSFCLALQCVRHAAHVCLSVAHGLCVSLQLSIWFDAASCPSFAPSSPLAYLPCPTWPRPTTFRRTSRRWMSGSFGVRPLSMTAGLTLREMSGSSTGRLSALLGQPQRVNLHRQAPFLLRLMGLATMVPPLYHRLVMAMKLQGTQPLRQMLYGKMPIRTPTFTGLGGSPGSPPRLRSGWILSTHSLEMDSGVLSCNPSREASGSTESATDQGGPTLPPDQEASPPESQPAGENAQDGPSSLPSASTAAGEGPYPLPANQRWVTNDWNEKQLVQRAVVYWCKMPCTSCNGGGTCGATLQVPSFPHYHRCRLCYNEYRRRQGRSTFCDHEQNAP